MKKLQTSTDKGESEDLLKKVNGMLDKLANKNIIHKNKAANLKSGLAKKVGIM